MFGRAAETLLVASGLLAASTVAVQAGDSASPTQFWVQQRSLPPDMQSRPEHPVFRPHRASATVRSERRGQTQASVAKPGFVVAVFGDSFGYDASRGLTDLFAGNPRVGMVDDTSDTASQTGTPLPAWGDDLTAAARTSGRVDAAVVMLGADDLQPLTDEHGLVVAPDSPAWRVLYADRVKRTAALFRDRKVPLIWVGLPVVRDDDLARHYAALNAIVRENASAAGATYVDSWAAFADENGHYAATGPDENGQPAKLRHEDGRRFTRAGARKLASFIQPELKRLEDKADAAAKLAAIGTTDADIFDQALTIDVNAQIRREAGLPPLPDPGQNRDGPIVELTAPPAAVDGRLATASTPVALAANADAVLSSGLPPLPRRGRTDDFAWPRP